MFILCRIAIAEAGKPCRKDTPHQLSFSNNCVSLFTFAFVSTSRWLAEIWQLSRRGATGKLEAEFKFQRRSCKLYFSFPAPSPEHPGELTRRVMEGLLLFTRKALIKTVRVGGKGLSVKWLRSKILLSFYITNCPLFFFVDMHLFASFRNK